MSFIQNLFTSRDNNANAATYVGQQDRLWWDPVTNAFYYSDGNTAGGILVGGGGSGNGVPGGPTNSIQYNAGSGNFGGTANIIISGNGISVVGNVSAAYFIGDGSQLTNLPSGASNKIYNGNSSANIASADGNLVININDLAAWNFGSDGNLTVPGDINTEAIGFHFNTPIANIHLDGTVVIVTLTDSIFGGPFTGYVKISAVTGMTEANGIWWAAATNPTEFILFLASSHSTLVDGSTWSAYVSGGIALHASFNNLNVNVGIQTWQFGTDGNLTLPAGSTISDFDGGDPNSTGTSLNGVDYAQIYWNGDPGNSNPYAGGNLYTWAYVDMNGFNVQYNNVANSINNDWNFNKDGNLTIPGNIVFRSSSASIFTANAIGNIGNVGNVVGFTNGVDANNYPNYFLLDQTGNVHIGQNTDDTTGAIIFDGAGSQIYETFVGGLTLQPAFNPATGNANITISAANANSYVYLQVVGDANIFGDLGADGIYSVSVSALGNVTGNYITGNYILGDGSQLTNLPTGNYSNSNVATFLGDFGSNVISTSGNITASGLLIDTVTGITSNAGNININQITGLGGYLNAFGANLLGNINAANLSLSGNIINDANISGNVNAANISASNISLSGNIFAYGANIYSVNGLTMEGGNLTMSSITGLGGSISAEGNIIGANLSATSNVSGQNINSGNLSLSGNVISDLNIQQGNISVSGNITSGSELTVVSANITGAMGLTVSGGDITIPASMSGGSLSAYGNITGNYIIGDGSQLTNLPVQPGTYGNSNVATFLGDFGSNTVSTTGSIISGNITGANILTGGLVSATGNVTSNFFIGNGSQLTSITGSNVSGQVGNALTAGTVYANLQPNITSVGTLSILSVSGNVTGGNLLTGGLISATGNISANTYTGNGSQLTGVATPSSVQRVLGLTMIYGGR